MKISSDEQKIDSEAVKGLLGKPNSLAYKVHEVEKHFHNHEHWRGKLAVQTATAWADDTLAPFRAISGADTYGADPNDEAQVFGLDDTPINGAVKFDPNRILITAFSTDTPWKLRMVFGTGTMADAIIARQFTEDCMMNTTVGSKAGGTPVTFTVPRLNCGIDKVWMQAWNETDNATCDFLIGLHEYIG
jgi:hypothetical protein